jgi:hypothetical protein
MRNADPRLARYVELLLACNRVLNVTGARDEAEVWEHIDDSLTLAPYVRDPHVDIGSGGGFPAIPLAIICGVRVTLIESIAKKARFLQESCSELGVEGGTALLQRGRFPDRERCAVSDAALVLGAEIGAEHTLAGSEEKRILLVHKRLETSARFPRRAGVPEKRPLCAE